MEINKYGKSDNYIYRLIMIDGLPNNDYKLQLQREILISFFYNSNMNTEERAFVNNRLKRIDDILINNYISLNSVWDNSLFKNNNILFPINDEITSYRLANKFLLANNIKESDLQSKHFIFNTPGGMNVYEKVINKILTDLKLLVVDDEDYRNSLIINLLKLGWLPEIDNITPELKLKCRQNLGDRLTKEINDSCYFVDCTITKTHYMYTGPEDYKNKNIYPYYIVIGNDNNYSIARMYKEKDIVDIYKYLGEYTGDITIYLFFDKDYDLDSDRQSWRSETYDIVDKSHPRYSCWLKNLIAARMIKSFKEVNGDTNNSPVIVKLLVQDKRPTNEELLNLPYFSKYCVHIENEEKPVIINYKSHVISPRAYDNACINTILEDYNNGY